MNSHNSLIQLTFFRACQHGCLEVAQRLLANNPTIDILANKKQVDRAFRIACEKGHLEVAQWLLQVKPDIDISVVDDYAFRCACYNGHLEVAQWLYYLALASTPPLGKVEAKIVGIDISADDEDAFRYACYYGHLKVAQWLLKVKPDINISAVKDWAFCSACFNGHLEVAQWMLSLRNGLAIDILSHYENIFCYAYKFKILKVMRWLLTVRPDKCTRLFINKKNITTNPLNLFLNNKKDQLWYRMQYLVELSMNKTNNNNNNNNNNKVTKVHPLYYLSTDIVWLLTFYV